MTTTTTTTTTSKSDTNNNNEENRKTATITRMLLKLTIRTIRPTTAMTQQGQMATITTTMTVRL